MKKLLESFTKKEFHKTNRTEFSIKIVIKRKGDKLNVNWKSYNNWFDSLVDKCKKDIEIKIELDLSNYATKSNWKLAATVDTSKFDKGG